MKPVTPPFYEDDMTTIYLADCSEVLPEIFERGKLWALVTDPPYGLGENTIVRGDYRKREGYGADWDNNGTPAPEVFDALLAGTVHQIIFGGNYFHLPISRGWLVWDKQQSGSWGDCELAWTNQDRALKRLRHQWSGVVMEGGAAAAEHRVHPTQKPIPVMKWCIEYLPPPPPDAVILDPFMGSGATLIAARQMGIKAIGIERDRRYCELAKGRLTGEIGLTKNEQRAIVARANGQLSLFSEA